jgi:hypothetical protein
MAARTNYTFSLAESSKLFFPETTREIEMLLGRNIPLKSLWVFFVVDLIAKIAVAAAQ